MATRARARLADHDPALLASCVRRGHSLALTVARASGRPGQTART